MIRLLILVGLFALVGCEDTEAVAQEKRKITSLECTIEANDWMIVQVEELETRADKVMTACAVAEPAPECLNDVAKIQSDIKSTKGEHQAKLATCRSLL